MTEQSLNALGKSFALQINQGIGDVLQREHILKHRSAHIAVNRDVPCWMSVSHNWLVCFFYGFEKLIDTN